MGRRPGGERIVAAKDHRVGLEDALVQQVLAAADSRQLTGQPDVEAPRVVAPAPCGGVAKMHGKGDCAWWFRELSPHRLEDGGVPEVGVATADDNYVSPG